MDISEDSPFCGIERREILEATDHLNAALLLLTDVHNNIVIGLIDFVETIEALTSVWNEINMCRVYTQHNVDFEELLIPAMGFVTDARLMLESLVAWKLGLTLYAKISILSSIREAITSGLGPAIVELENCTGRDPDR